MSETQRAAYQAEKLALQRLLELTETARTAELAELESAQPELAAILKRRLALAGPAEPAAASTELTLPSIPRYRIEKIIGRGGMGCVWLAVRADGADQQQLAIKQIRPEAIDSEALRRFEAERRALARLDHPHIVPLLDAGTDASGAPFLVTPFVHGESLKQFAERPEVSVRERVQLMLQIASALAHAHQQLIVHRDLKPANILVEPGSAGEPPRVRLLDFGIAKLLDSETELTATGASLMTLRYAAPEQLSAGTQGTSCDLYALGVLSYELLSGRSPYGDLRDPAALIQAITQGPVAPLRHSATGQNIPADLSAIVLKLLRKQPSDRYPSADALVAELERWLKGEPVLVMRGERSYQARIWLRRRWPWLAVASAVLLALGFHLRSMDAQLQISERERQKAQEIGNFMVTLFQSASPADTQQGGLSALDLLKLASARLLSPEAEQLSAEGRAALLVNTGHAFYQMDLQSTAREMFAKAAELYAQSPTASPTEHAEALRFVAMSHYSSGDYQAALRNAQAAKAVLVAAGDSTSKELASILNSTCVYLGVLAQPSEASACYQELQAFYRAKGPLDKEGVVAWINSAAFENSQGSPQRGEALLREAQAVLGTATAESVRNDSPIVLKRHLATSLREQGHYPEAIVLFNEVISENQAFEGKDSRGLIPAYTGLAATLTLNQQLNEAEQPLRDALRLAQAAYPPAHRNTLNVRLEKARWLLAKGATEQAKSELEETQTLRKQQTPLDRSGNALAIATLAAANCRLGETAAAQQQFSQAFEALAEPGLVTAQRLAQARAWRAECG